MTNSDKKRILVCAAWPYVYTLPHLGNFICILAGDCLTRYFKLCDYDVEFVSGSDEHGTKMEHEAKRLGISPQALVDGIHNQILEFLEKFSIEFTNYSRTSTQKHKDFVTDFYRQVQKNGYVEMKEEQLPFCTKCDIFLADRYIIGTCPHCGNKESQGNQCSECGRILEPTELIDAQCSTCGTKPEIKKTVNAFFDLPRLEPQLKDYVKQKKDVWQPRVRHFTERWIEEGLHERSLTRDVAWGIKSPFEGHEQEKQKTLYVWVEAVLGYVSTVSMRGRLDEFWKQPVDHSYFCLGKDNIPFHTIIFPAILLAHGGYNLPDVIVSNEYLQFFGKQFSKTKGIGIWLDELLDILTPDYWRFYTFRIFPDSKDTNFDWKDFGEKINNELVANIANFVNRVLSLTDSYYEGKVPEKKLTDEEQALLKEIQEVKEKVHNAFLEGNVRDGLDAALILSKKGNEYLQQQAPWNNEQNRDCLYVAAIIARAVGILLSPYLPDTYKKMQELFDLNDTTPWGTLTDFNKPLGKPYHLFEKIDVAEVEQQIQDKRELAAYGKLDLRVAEIISVEEHIKADKLYVLKIKCPEERQLVAGLKGHYSEEELTGKKIVIVANLEPVKLRGVESQGMLLAAEDNKGTVSVLTVSDAGAGTEVLLEGVKRKPEPVVAYEVFQKVTLKTQKENIVLQNHFLTADSEKVVAPGVADGSAVH